MSSFIFPQNYSTGVSEERQVIRKRVSRNRIRRLLVGFIALMGFLILFQLAWSFLLLPNMLLKDIQIHSMTHFPSDPDQVKAIIGLDAGAAYPDIEPKRIESLLMNSLMVEEVIVEKRFPDRLVIRLRERVPVAMGLFQADDGRTVPVHFDREGLVIAAGSGVEYYDLPVISGEFDFPVPVQGEQLPAGAVRLSQKLNQIRLDNPELYRLVSEAEMKDQGSDNFEIVLYIRGHRLPVRMKENFTELRLFKAIRVMDALKDVGLDKGIDWIDYRSDHITYSYQPGDQHDD